MPFTFPFGIYDDNYFIWGKVEKFLTHHSLFSSNVFLFSSILVEEFIGNR
jgi:hypothetical protein